ncbi:O-antigen ligase family protein [Deinococcus radiotolerans]|uniref:O-antigen ligase family protein n=1 Tax=Deinococcus radiotolerans TaxID=1309407 RepID=UPI001669AD8E|nr:O-antigen ligase family protein [Deinococcus radiotolerans]
MTTQQDETSASPPPQWVSWLIALVPVLPPLYLASFSRLRDLASIPQSAKYLIGGFLLTQLISTAFTDNPVLSLLLIGLHSFLILSLIAVGLYLKSSIYVFPIIYGQVFIIISSWIFTILENVNLLNRLSGPYYHSVSLGFTAALFVWLVYYSDKGLIFKISMIIIALITLLATGSRGAALALITGFIGAILKRNLRFIFFAFLCILLLLPVMSRGNSVIFDHISGRGLSHRDVVWAEALSSWKKNPIGGVGLYQAGPHITQLMVGGCSLTQAAEIAGASCPKSLEAFISANLTAHNLVINQGLSTGIIGLLGFLVLFIYFARQIILTDSPLPNAILFGYTFMNIFDVTVILPTLHYGELFWVFCGFTFLIRSKKNNKNIANMAA